MTDSLQTNVSSPRTLAVDLQQAWQMVLGQLRQEMSRVDYETWIKPMLPVEYLNQVFTLGAHNDFARQWAETRLTATAARMLQGIYGEPVRLKVVNLYDYMVNLPATEVRRPYSVGSQNPRPGYSRTRPRGKPRPRRLPLARPASPPGARAPPARAR